MQHYKKREEEKGCFMDVRVFHQTKKPVFVFLLVLMSIFFAAGTILSAQQALQTQESDLWDGVIVDLTRVSIKNNVITVKLKLKNEGTEQQSVRIVFRSCYIMDEANQKKYYALKDSDGIFIAGPQHDQDQGGRFWFSIPPGKSKSMWLKFPEPTDNPETISISIPGIPPFDEVELKK